MASLLTEIPTEQTTAQQIEYWNRIARGWPPNRRITLWRQYSDQVNGALVSRWLPPGRMNRVLKTNLFEEAIGDGLYPLLRRRAGSTLGIDLALTTVARAQGRYAQLKGLVADVRRLPFKNGSFDAIVSTSTLDHFGRATDVENSIAELNRVLRPGGEQVITMDNTRNPVLELRGMVQPLCLKLGLLPYFTGVSCDAPGLRRLLTQAGFQIRDETTVLHSPRAPAMVVARVLDSFALSRLNRYYLSFLGGFERLAGSRAGRLTGYFVAARTVKY